MIASTDVPDLVAAAQDRAAGLGFSASCADPAGPLLATLAAAVPPGGRILELGTGAGVGAAWLASAFSGGGGVGAGVSGAFSGGADAGVSGAFSGGAGAGVSGAFSGGAGAGVPGTFSGGADVTVTSIEVDPELVHAVRGGEWPPFVEFVEGDAADLLPTLGTFDLIFADALAGKWTDLGLTIAALAPGGMLLVDDMDPGLYHEPEHVAAVRAVDRALLTDPRLTAVRLPVGTSFILATRLR